MTSRSGRGQQRRLHRLHYVSIWYLFPAVFITHQAPPLESRERTEGRRSGERLQGRNLGEKLERERIWEEGERKKRQGEGGWKFDCFCNWAMQWQSVWSRWNSVHSGFKRMPVQETGGEEEERGTALRLTEKRASAHRRKAVELLDVCVVASVETHVAVWLWWLAVLLLLLLLSYCMCLSVCVHSWNQQCVFSVGVWQLSTHKPPNPTTELQLRSEMRLNQADRFYHKLDLSFLGLIEAVYGLRQAQWLIVFETEVTVSEGRRVENQFTILLRLSLVGSGYTSEY